MSAPAKEANPPRNPEAKKAFGIRIHNLVYTKDSGDEYAEFRVQCEMRLPKPHPDGSKPTAAEIKKAQEDGDRIAVLLRDVNNPTSLSELENIVSDYIYDDATTIFRAAVRNAFLDHSKDPQR